MRNITWWLAPSACFLAANAFGQALPDPSVELQRQQQQIKELRQRLEPSADVRLDSNVAPSFKRLAESEDPCFLIQRIQIDGLLPQFDGLNEALSGPERNDSPIGRCLGSKGVQLLSERLQNRLISNGYITSRVETPPQDLKDGTLTFSVIAGRLGAIRLESSGSTSVRGASPIAQGDLLNLRDVEQALENLRSLPSAEADIQIAPGELPGHSDLIVRYQQQRPWRVALSADDSGSKATGKYQGNATLSYDNPFKLNDLIYLTLQHDLGGGDPGQRGSRGHVLHYSIPWGYWRFSATSSRSPYYQTIFGATQNYIYRGESTSHELQIDRLLQRSASSKTSMSFKAFARRSSNFIDDTEVEVQRRRTGGWEVNAAYQRYLESATVDTRLAYKRGTGAFGSMPAPEELFGEGTSRMKLYIGQIGVEAPFSAASLKWQYSAQFKAQWNRTPLTPQDRFCIGGRYTVRGFDGIQTLCAERGQLWRNEISTALGGSGSRVYGGVDLGRVSGYVTGQLLTGAFVGVRGNIGTASVDVFVGQPIRKPAGFDTAGTTYGITMNTSF